MSVVLRADALTKRHHRGREVVTAVDRVSFELTSGSLTALVGPSGSGKTTLLNLLVGGDVADEGRISGLPVQPDWSQVAVVPQALGLLPELTIGENVGLPLRLGATGCGSPDAVLEGLGIDGLVDRATGETSLGEQQRAAVARALLASPVLLVADEPTSHQDEQNARRVIEAFAELAAAGSSVLIATHDERVLDACDRILRMSDGVVS